MPAFVTTYATTTPWTSADLPCCRTVEQPDGSILVGTPACHGMHTKAPKIQEPANCPRVLYRQNARRWRSAAALACIASAAGLMDSIPLAAGSPLESVTKDSDKELYEDNAHPAGDRYAILNLTRYVHHHSLLMIDACKL